jgi:hypothetical protein
MTPMRQNSAQPVVPKKSVSDDQQEQAIHVVNQGDAITMTEPNFESPVVRGIPRQQERKTIQLLLEDAPAIA